MVRNWRHQAWILFALLTLNEKIGEVLSQTAPCSLFNEAMFDSLATSPSSVYTYAGLCTAITNWNIDPANAANQIFMEGTDDLRKKELAAFVGHTLHESGSYAAPREYRFCGTNVEESNTLYCKPDTVPIVSSDDYCSTDHSLSGGTAGWQYGCNCVSPESTVTISAGSGYVDSNKLFYGRGAIQLSWNYNYYSASLALVGDTTFCTQPELVATTTEYAWGTAIWFWMTSLDWQATDGNQGTRTSHDYVVSGDFGGSLVVINSMECTTSAYASTVTRLNHYCNAALTLGLDSPLGFSACTGLQTKYDTCKADNSCPKCVELEAATTTTTTTTTTTSTTTTTPTTTTTTSTTTTTPTTTTTTTTDPTTTTTTTTDPTTTTTTTTDPTTTTTTTTDPTTTTTTTDPSTTTTTTDPTTTTTSSTTTTTTPTTTTTTTTPQTSTTTTDSQTTTTTDSQTTTTTESQTTTTTDSQTTTTTDSQTTTTTDSQTTTTPGGTGGTTTNGSTATGLYYPDWEGTNDRCIADNGSAPDYMRMNPTAYMHSSLDACCTARYAWNYRACIGTAGSPTNLYFPNWGSTPHICLLDDGTSATAPDYIRNSQYLMSTTLELCCSANYNWNLAACLAGGATTTTAATTPISTTATTTASTGLWYVSYSEDKCVQDCVGNAPCGGIASYEQLFGTAALCCSTKLSYVAASKCEASSLGVAPVGSNKWYVKWDEEKCVQDCDAGGSCGGLADSWDPLYDNTSACCQRINWKTEADCLS